MDLTAIIAMAILILVGAFLGYFGIWFFNRMPASWLCDYDKEPSEELLDSTRQRIKTYPYKYIMVVFMILVGVKVSFGDVYIAAGSMLAIWSLMLMAVADKKYMIVPDQLIIVLMLSAIGFIPHYISFMEPLLGGLIAFGIMGAIALLGKIVFKRWVLGGGDVKVYTALGIIFGWKGFAVIFVLATFASAIHYAYLLIKGKAKRDEERPLIPYVFGGACLYLLILYPGINQIWL